MLASARSCAPTYRVTARSPDPTTISCAALVAIAGDGIIAAGGIASIDHIRNLNYIGVGGVVIGRALYTGDIDLAEAVNVIGGTTGHIC